MTDGPTVTTCLCPCGCEDSPYGIEVQQSFRLAVLKTLSVYLAAIERHDTDYDKRYGLVFDALSLALHAGLTAGIRIDPNEPEWPVVYIDLPEAGQISWHVPQYALEWDGHDAAEKYRRCHTFIETSQ